MLFEKNRKGSREAWHKLSKSTTGYRKGAKSQATFDDIAEAAEEPK